MGETVDLLVSQGRIDKRPSEQDVAVLSYVLGEISSKRVRAALLTDLWRATRSEGTLVVFDDFNPDALHHLKASSRRFFHKLRLGWPLVEELGSCGWFASVISTVPRNLILAESDIPFIIARKQQVDNLTIHFEEAMEHLMGLGGRRWQ